MELISRGHFDFYPNALNLPHICEYQSPEYKVMFCGDSGVPSIGCQLTLTDVEAKGFYLMIIVHGSPIRSAVTVSFYGYRQSLRESLKCN